MPDTVNPPDAAPSPAAQLLAFLEQRGKELSPLLILTHDYPDPDALASAFALQHLAQQRFGIDCRIAYGGVIGRVENRAMASLLRIPARRLRKTDVKRFRNVALVDTQPSFKNNPFPASRRAAMIIDQHASTARPCAELVLVDTTCGATCVILAQALILAKIDIPSRVATALAYGILSDTMDLYRATRPDVVQTYLDVLHHSDMRTLARIQNPLRSRSFFSTLGRCVREAQVHRKLLVAHLGRVQNPDMVSQMADFLLTYDRAAWTFCTGRYKGSLHASLRTSQTDVHAGEILRDAFENRKNAGGHRSIAGGSVRVGVKAPEETWRDREQAIQLRLVKRLRQPSKGGFRKAFTR